MQVTSCAASGVASIAVGSEGTLYGFGRSKRGQLGLGKGRIAADAPERIPGVEGVTAVSCGWGHALAITGAQHLPFISSWLVWMSGVSVLLMYRVQRSILPRQST